MPQSSGRLAGKIALVTGGGRGIGEGISRVFASEGAKVIIGEIDEQVGKTTASDIGKNAIFLPLDVTSDGSWRDMIAEIKKRFGKLDVLVNNAGSGVVVELADETYEQHCRIVNLNITGVWAGMKAAISLMKDGGSIVNISSIDGLVGVSHMVTYAASKFAVTGMTRSLAIELGDRGIRVNSIHPGMIETPMMKGAPAAALARVKASLKQQPIKRFGQPREVGLAALFFASDDSSFCTGTGVVVDGGHIAGPSRDH